MRSSHLPRAALALVGSAALLVMAGGAVGAAVAPPVLTAVSTDVLSGSTAVVNGSGCGSSGGEASVTYTITPPGGPADVSHDDDIPVAGDGTFTSSLSTDEMAVGTTIDAVGLCNTGTTNTVHIVVVSELPTSTTSAAPTTTGSPTAAPSTTATPTTAAAAAVAATANFTG